MSCFCSVLSLLLTDTQEKTGSIFVAAYPSTYSEHLEAVIHAFENELSWAGLLTSAVGDPDSACPDTELQGMVITLPKKCDLTTKSLTKGFFARSAHINNSCLIAPSRPQEGCCKLWAIMGREGLLYCLQGQLS